MNLVPGLHERAQEPLQIQFRAAGGGILATDQREFHAGR